MLRRLTLLLLPVVIGGAQTTPNSITVTASRNANLQPDQVVFAIAVSTSLSGSRDEVAGALRGAGITPNFTSVRTVQTYDARGNWSDVSLEWSFTLTDAISNMKAALDLLSGAQKSIAQSGKGMSMAFSVAGTEVSAKAQQAQACSMQDLIADARAQAMKLSTAAAKGLGPILAISGATTGPNPASSFLFAPPTYYPVCSLTVKFALEAF